MSVRASHPVGQVDNAAEFLKRGGAVENTPQAVVGERNDSDGDQEEACLETAGSGFHSPLR